MGAMPQRQPSIDLTFVGFVLAACVALGLLVATQWLATQERNAADWTLESQEVLAVIADTRAALVDIQNGHRGFTIEGTEDALRPYYEGTATIEKHAARLRELLKDSPRQQAHLAEFERVLPARLETAARIVDARRAGGADEARRILAMGAAAREMAALRAVLDAMDRQQERVFRQRAEQQHVTFTRLATGVGAVSFLLLPALGLLYAQIRRRRLAQQELLALNETLEARVAQRTSELSQANADMEQARLRLQQLSARIVDHQEQERRRVAYELHEDMAQSMSAIRIDIVRAQREADSGQPLTDAIALLDALIGQTRDMVARLRPTMLDDLGLPDALDGELSVHAKRNGWKTSLAVEPQDFPALPPQVATAAFRVAQEALSNAARHARAQQVDVRVRLTGRELVLSVEDDGAGFANERQMASDTDADSFGLAFMRERARQVEGSLDIGRGSGGRGVRVSLSVPLSPAVVEA